MELPSDDDGELYVPIKQRRAQKLAAAGAGLLARAEKRPRGLAAEVVDAAPKKRSLLDERHARERSLLESSGYASPAQALGSPAVSEIDEDEEGRWDTDSVASESESSEDDDAFLQRELLARRGALGTASAEDASDIRIKQETALERAKERREAKAATAAAEQCAAKVREADEPSSRDVSVKVERKCETMKRET